jgi:hypothetical protein
MKHSKARRAALSTASLALLLIWSGCAGAAIQGVKLLTKGSPAGVESPEKLAQAVIEAANNRDAEAFGNTFPSDEVLSELIECPSGWGPLEGVRAERNRLTNIVASTNIRLESVEIDHASTEPKQYFVENSLREGCQLKADFVTVRFRVYVVETVEGTTRERDDSVLLIRSDEGWFLAGMERRVAS